MHPDPQSYASIVKKTAAMLGFDQCGIAKAVRLDEDARRLESWLQQGMHGEMHYMANHFDMRVDPSLLVPGAKSVITLLINYFPENQQPHTIPQIAKYAYGKDYHEVIRAKLREFLFLLKQEIGEIEGRGFVDSAPVLERSWAVRSGLGWIGKNGNLLAPRTGSFFFIATLFVDVELAPDAAFKTDHCGDCTRCIDACPTDAILPGKVVDGSKCISYFTIELKDKLIPGSEKGKFENWMFGCDTCQDVCPWNRFSKPTSEPAFKPLQEILSFSLSDWNELQEDTFKQIFAHSPLKRAKFDGIKRNLRFIQS
jgi:epoxyqueuosine reductase